MRDLKVLINITGRRALVTGGAIYVGRKIGDSPAELGSEIPLVHMPTAPPQAVAEEFTKCRGGIMTALSCDLQSTIVCGVLAPQINHAGLSVLVKNRAFVGSFGLSDWPTTSKTRV